MINGERVRQARELRGFTQTELAGRVGVRQSTIAHIETGRSQPSKEVLEAIALQTGFPPAFFRQDTYTDFPLGTLQFRARMSMSAAQREQAHQYAKTIYEGVQKMAERIKERPVRLPRLEDPPDTAARVARAALGLAPDTPIKHLTNALERGGVLVLALPVELEKREAYSLWTGEDLDKPVIVVTEGSPGDRLRLSIAHEVGHLVMHQAPKGDLKTIEREAFRFAGEFLMPEQAIRDELIPPITLTSLAELKPRWRVSMGALAQRARDLGIISPRQLTYLRKQLTKHGWHRAEPPNLAVPPEKPRAVRKMAELLYGNPIDYKRLASDTNLTEQFVKEIIEAHADRNEMFAGGEREAPQPATVFEISRKRTERSRLGERKRGEG